MYSSGVGKTRIGFAEAGPPRPLPSASWDRGSRYVVSLAENPPIAPRAVRREVCERHNFKFQTGTLPSFVRALDPSAIECASENSKLPYSNSMHLFINGEEKVFASSLSLAELI